MIGPGTGVAPYRAFLQHREAQGARGRNWLLFGARHFASEFLYQVEWQEAQRKRAPATGSISPSRATTRRASTCRIGCASTDASSSPGSRAARTSTSAAMRSSMAPDVNAALIDIAAEHGGLDREDGRGLGPAARRRAPLSAGRVLNMSELSPVELIKRESRGLRGTLRREPRRPGHRRAARERHAAASSSTAATSRTTATSARSAASRSSSRPTAS